MARHRAENSSDEDQDQPASERSALAEVFWTDVRVDPVEIALPKGVGYTLRAYRMSDKLPSDEDAEEVEDVEGAEEAAADSEDELDDELDEAEDDDTDDDDTEDEPDEAEPEEVPVFLAQDGQLLMFRSPQGLVEFIRSDEPHDLTALDTWEQVAVRIQDDYVVPGEDDRYELDLLVENLRGGHDAWDLPLVISAGEIARDIGYALRIRPILTALSTGSPLDDLDEAARAADGGGLGAFFARRRVRKIGAQQAALAWRTIIGKISTAVDWRD